MMTKKERNEYICRLYKRGYTLREITAHEKIDLSSISQIYKILIDNGIKVRKAGSKCPSYDDLYDLHIKQKLRQTDIADLYEVTDVTVNHWLQKYKLRACDRNEQQE